MKRSSRSLFDPFSLDAPHVTETRRALQFLIREDGESQRKVYMVTSATRGEGKSISCALLAIVAARMFQRRTLIIDTDLRRPSLHRLLSCSQGPGLFELMREQAKPSEVTQSTAVPLLSAIMAGKVSGSMGEAYDDKAFRRLLDSLRPQYDMIFVDSAPVVPVIEPLLIAEHADALLVVTMAGKTAVAMIRRMRQVLSPFEQKIVGAILNNATEGLPYYYDYRYYGYEQPKPRRIRRNSPRDTEVGSSSHQRVARVRESPGIREGSG